MISYRWGHNLRHRYCQNVLWKKEEIQFKPEAALALNVCRCSCKILVHKLTELTDAETTYDLNGGKVATEKGGLIEKTSDKSLEVSE